jgi:hypothetical protein
MLSFFHFNLTLIGFSDITYALLLTIGPSSSHSKSDEKYSSNFFLLASKLVLIQITRKYMRLHFK